MVGGGRFVAYIGGPWNWWEVGPKKTDGAEIETPATDHSSAFLGLQHARHEWFFNSVSVDSFLNV